MICQNSQKSPFYRVNFSSGTFLHVSRNYPKMGRGKCFALKRVDGSVETFSYKSCLDGKFLSKRAAILEAMRFIIKPQMKAYRDQLNYPVKCAISEQLIYSPSELHVDHKCPTFNQIALSFLKEKGISFEDVEISGNGESVKLFDSGLKNDFCNFHLLKAIYQPLTLKSHIVKSENER